VKEIVPSALTLLTADLSLAPRTPPGALDTARRAVAMAEITGQKTDFLTRPSPVETSAPSAATLRALSSLVIQLGPAQPEPTRVVRREFGTRVSSDPRVGPTPGAGQAPTTSLGPFLDAFHRPVWIDVFTLPKMIGVQRAGDSQPFLYVFSAPPTGNGDKLTLGPGSVWITAQQLAPGVPASSFVGLRIKSGTVSFGATNPLGSTPIIVPAASTLTLTLTLDPATPLSGSGPGADARTAQVVTPAQVTFRFTAAGGGLSTAGNATLTAFGTTLKLVRQPAAAHYDPLFGRVDFPFAHDLADFAMASSQSTLVTLAGTAPIFGAAWSLAVTITTPDSLAAAGGAGGLAVGLQPGVTVQWTGRDAPADCGLSVLVAEPEFLAIGGLGASAANVPQVVPLWNESTLVLRTPGSFPFRFVSQASGQEVWAFIPSVTSTLDQPRTVNNARVRLAGPALVILIEEAASTLLIVEAAAPPHAASSIQSYAIKNLLLKASNPLTLLVVATLSGDTAAAGIAVLQFNLRLLLPILPDPYATNLAFDPHRAIDTGVVGTLTMVLRWQDANLVTLDLLLPAGAESGISTLPPQPAPQPPSGELSQSLAQDADNLSRIKAQFDSVVGGGGAGPTLLDLSTNVSQFGVSFGVGTAREPIAVSPVNLSIADLFLQAPGLDLRVVTLPAVQWEPVLTPDQSTPFPSPLSYANSGATTEFAAKTVTLVPIAPRQAIDALLAAYHAVPSSEVVARFTLPFGIAAVARLIRSKSVVIPSPSLEIVQPGFTSASLKGGDQISMRAARPLTVLIDGESPSFAGAAVQLHNARAAGTPTATTVLTPIDDTFNNNFSPSATSPRVPVTRIDISGFGESLFSDWRNPTDAAAIISKARFDVVVGRTAREVVQARSVLYPYAVRVVRTITIERQNGAAVVRHDSGWQAVTDGVYSYPDPALITHPGVVRGVVAVSNIRDTGQRHTTPDGSELMAVRFDCAVNMENVVAGAGPNGVPARDQLGYVQLTVAPGQKQLAPDQYAELIAAVGGLGGLIDCTIDIGGTGQRMRVARVGVADSPGMGGPEFVMAAWGSPVLPGGGQWSFLRQAAGDLAPQAVDRDQGVPMVRAGPAPASPPTSSPYRFADPADLLQPDNPAADYGVLQATGTQRLLFPRPKLEATGAKAVTSTRAPVLADPFALGTATGPFPRIDACIPFPDANYALAIGAGGNFVLQRPTPSFTTPVLKRVLRESKALRTIAYTADENNTPSVVTVAVDTAAVPPWSVNITNLSLASESGSHGEVARVVGTIDSNSKAPTQLANARFVFGPALQPVAALVAFLEHFGPLPPPTIAMTNEFSVQTGLKADLTKLDGYIPPPIRKILDNFIVDLDLKILAKITETKSSFVTQFELTVKFPTPFTVVAADGSFSGIVGIALAKVQVQLVDDVTAVTLQIGGGIGVAFTIVTFKAIAYYASTIFLIVGDTVFGVGASSLLKGSIDLKIVEVDVSIEAKVVLLNISCNVSDSAIWGVAQVTIAVEISLFFGFDIEFDVQAEWTNNFNGGSCALPDVV
jgi:hypothetical protein